MNRLKSRKHAFCNTEEIVDKTKLIAFEPRIKSKENKAPTKNEIKKTLVRNTDKHVPITEVTKDDLKEHSNKGIQTDTKRRQTCTKNSPTSFEVPKPNTLIQLSKKIECLDKEEQTRVEKKIAADEKVLRNLNFPNNRPIYKDLIPLACDRTDSPPSSVRNPLPQKDKEPLLSDFVETKKIPKYYVLPSVDVEDKILPGGNNNLRVYKILAINS